MSFVRDQLQGSIVDGRLVILSTSEATGSAELRWTLGEVSVFVFGERVDGTTCRIQANSVVDITPISIDPVTRYVVEISRDRMEAALTVVLENGIGRIVQNTEVSSRIIILCEEETLPYEQPTLAAALSALQEQQVVFGIDEDAVRMAVEEPGKRFVIAVGENAIEGKDGFAEPLVDPRDSNILGLWPKLRWFELYENVKVSLELMLLEKN